MSPVALLLILIAAVAHAAWNLAAKRGGAGGTAFVFGYLTLALVALVRELSIVLVGLLAWRVLGEPNPARSLAGAVTVLTGIVALAV